MMKKNYTRIFVCALLLFAAVATFAQKEEEGNNGNTGSTGSTNTAVNSARDGFIPDHGTPLPNRAEVMEGFDDVTNLPGWAMQNNSDSPGTTDWFQGNPAVLTAHMGADDAYIAANFNNTGGSVISNWLMTPELDFDTLQTFSFWTRKNSGSTFPDRMEVRISDNGASTNVGSAPTDVGDFTDVVLQINPGLTVGGYPDVWTQFVLDDFSGYTGTGRIAFRYWVTDAGPVGSNSDFIGIDTVQTTEVSCTITSVTLGDSDNGGIYITLNGDCADGVDVRADATGEIVATNVVVNGSTTIMVDFVADSTYSALLPGGGVVTSLNATVPTLGEWGMVAFLLLLMGSGLFFLRKRRLV